MNNFLRLILSHVLCLRVLLSIASTVLKPFFIAPVTFFDKFTHCQRFLESFALKFASSWSQQNEWRTLKFKQLVVKFFTFTKCKLECLALAFFQSIPMLVKARSLPLVRGKIKWCSGTVVVKGSLTHWLNLLNYHQRSIS